MKYEIKEIEDINKNKAYELLIDNEPVLASDSKEQLETVIRVQKKLEARKTASKIDL